MIFRNFNKLPYIKKLVKIPVTVHSPTLKLTVEARRIVYQKFNP
jgi:hypothetical protein